MLTYLDALKTVLKAVPDMKATACLDYGKFYAFTLVPTDVKDPSSYIGGTWMYYVLKSNGMVGMFDVTADWDAYNNAKIMPI